METVKFNCGSVRTVAHRGLSAISIENTLPAFYNVAKLSHFGVECDVHVTADGRYVIFHDDTTGRVCDGDLEIEKSSYADLRALKFKADPTGSVVIPSLEEFLQCLVEIDRHAFIEFKRPMTERDISQILRMCIAARPLSALTFISFELDNLITLRKLCPAARAMLLCCELTEEIEHTLIEHGLGLDIHYRALTAEAANRLHGAGIEINCWTCDDPAAAQLLVQMGVDYITTDLLEGA